MTPPSQNGHGAAVLSRLAATTGLCLVLLSSLGSFRPVAASGQQSATSQATPDAALARDPRSWVDSAVAYERNVIEGDSALPLRYRIRKVDHKNDVVRVEMETRQGAVARLVERNGEPLTAAEDAAEQERLKDVLAHRAEFVKHHKRDAGARQDTLALVAQMPAAMTYTYAPGQPQSASFAGPQVVLDFEPNRNYHPPTMASEMLTGVAGRIWIDRRSGRVVRVEAHVLHPVSFGWGLVGKIYPGGTIVLEQANPAGDRWVYSKLDLHLNLRVVVKGVAMDEGMSATGFEVLPGPLDVEDAVRQLLAMKIPTR